MRNTIKIVVLFLMLLTVSCTMNNQSNDYLVLNNKVLEREIEGYAKFVDPQINEPYVISVFCSEVNDSTSRYIINFITDPEDIQMWPYHFVCKIGERDVFFTMLAGIGKIGWKNNNFFYLKKEACDEFVKKYLPDDYKYYKKGTNKVPLVLYDTEMCYLTFVNDKLVKKELRRGLPWW
nr:hypothetical protein [uncultured Bacteroides sp.]